ncbi:putative secreted protein with PEP-CTERM sorting signal [Rhizobium sp. AG855]|nr:putative secreted protein with PEP-CTERM sorting signal [Rhizobium sp. AG855]
MIDITATSGFFNQAGLFLLGVSILAGLYLLLRRRQSR